MSGGETNEATATVTSASRSGSSSTEVTVGKKESGLLTSEFWMNGGAGAGIVAMVDGGMKAITENPAIAWPAAVAIGSGALALAGIGVGFALMRTRRKESLDQAVSDAAIAASGARSEQ